VCVSPSKPVHSKDIWKALPSYLITAVLRELQKYVSARATSCAHVCVSNRCRPESTSLAVTFGSLATFLNTFPSHVAFP
jgi:hypothetical protein